MIKKMCYSVMLCLMIIPTISAQKSNEIKAKEALNVIRISYDCWNCTCLEPQAYLTNPNSKRIIGQNFLLPSDEGKYVKISLNWKDNTIPSALFQNDKVTLFWEKDQIVRISAALDGFDYRIIHNQKGMIDSIIGTNIINQNMKIVRIPEFTGQTLSKVTHYLNNILNKDSWIYKVTTYTYKPNETMIRTITYKSGKPNMPQTIYDSCKTIYKKVDPNTFILIAPWNATIQYVYNKNNTLASKKTVKRSIIEECKYKYLNDKLFREDKLVLKNNNEFVEKEIHLYFSLSEQSNSVPDYEKTQGRYKFDKQGELIYEERDNKHREKINGTWNAWKYFEM